MTIFCWEVGNFPATSASVAEGLTEHSMHHNSFHLKLRRGGNSCAPKKEASKAPQINDG